ncbi:DNA-directed DNA polymerase [Thiomicrospira aerophila AL3]|uniref:DNA-directed DNA polymerase n=1 Tax=Thiomicrospira aerophila AL3 TaxID=717772 RepID=W0DRY4_9GAMM|nr:Y-family DNA polymerase [Thiomicrospira aerophila]AHF01187.1 DNA-directed DNA polymerase [Thiomicrospira aerophila AL3]
MAVFALVDANSFYASCEISFRPDLAKRPVVVLSNNDGCIVAANHIAKDLVKHHARDYGQGGYAAAKPTSMMFQPYFKVADVLTRYNTAVFSSNYELYGDMSARMHRMLGEYAAGQEIYSIDESFLDLSGMTAWNLTDYAQLMRSKIKQGLGLPVAVGIGGSKTLAKLANHLAKKQVQFDGVLDLTALSLPTQTALLRQVPIEDVWGVGRRMAPKLQALNIHTAYDLQQANPKQLRRHFSVVMERLIAELNGESCLSLEAVAPAKQQIIRSRSFGQPIVAFDWLAQAVASYTARAAEKLRQQGSVCQHIHVHLRTNPYDSKQPYYANSHGMGLVYPTDNSQLLIKLAKRLLKRVWQPGLAYHKAAVTLSAISDKGPLQLDVFAPEPKFSANPKSDALMTTLDAINQKMGRGSIQFAAEGLADKAQWAMRRAHCSPRYTTRIDEVLVVS